MLRHKMGLKAAAGLFRNNLGIVGGLPAKQRLRLQQDRIVSQPPQSQYRQLIEKVRPASSSKRTAESELDRLLSTMEEHRRSESKSPAAPKRDPLQVLREQMAREYVPAFVELVEKYSKAGIAMHMDASNLLEGGRDLQFEFSLGAYRMELQGTVTSDAIAFHEVRHAPDIEGQLVAGPMLRLKTLTADTFREFVCARLSILLRLTARRP